MGTRGAVRPTGLRTRQEIAPCCYHHDNRQKVRLFIGKWVSRSAGRWLWLWQSRLPRAPGTGPHRAAEMSWGEGAGPRQCPPALEGPVTGPRPWRPAYLLRQHQRCRRVASRLWQASAARVTRGAGRAPAWAEGGLQGRGSCQAWAGGRGHMAGWQEAAVWMFPGAPPAEAWERGKGLFGNTAVLAAGPPGGGSSAGGWSWSWSWGDARGTSRVGVEGSEQQPSGQATPATGFARGEGAASL